MNNNDDDDDDKMIIEDIDSEKEDLFEDNANYEIITYGADYTLSVFFDKMRKDEIIVPGFQRKYVWSRKQASRLIESFLLGLPVPGIFLSKEKDGTLLVVDGQQRLKTIQAYINGKLPITEEDFFLNNVKAEWEGKFYKDLESADKRKLDDSVLRATIIQQVNPKDNTSVYHIFERLNTGGTTLQSQEIRNCVYHGAFNDLLHELNKEKIWRTMYNSQTPSKRMKDEELILRFFAIYYRYDDYKKPMNEFLSQFMADNRRIGSDKKVEFTNLFIKTINEVNKKLGIVAFRPKRNLNMAAFDSIMYVFAKYSESLVDNIKDKLIVLFNDVAYIKAITQGTTDEETIASRIKIATRYLVK
ncbi:MAG: DUF262 domain-containing protein [Spirochaetia bacterium]|nr:DUF262 domain-containing protein [Spirochaetia bacterium]